MSVRVHLCCPNPPAQAIAGVIAQAGATVVDASTVTDDVVRQGLDCDILALASTTLGSVAPARLIAHVRAQAPRVRVILLMDHEDQALIDEAMKAGFYDWTVGDAVAHELPRLLAQGRTYADVVRMPAVEVEERSAFAGGRPFRLVVGMAESAHAAVVRTLDRRHKGEYEVVAEARTFDALVQATTPEVDGVVTASFLTGPFDLTTRIRLLAGVTKGVVMMLLVPADPPEAETLLEEHGFVGIRGERVEQDGKPRLVFAPERFDGKRQAQHTWNRGSGRPMILPGTSAGRRADDEGGTARPGGHVARADCGFSVERHDGAGVGEGASGVRVPDVLLGPQVPADAGRFGVKPAAVRTGHGQGTGGGNGRGPHGEGGGVRG